MTYLPPLTEEDRTAPGWEVARSKAPVIPATTFSIMGVARVGRVCESSVARHQIVAYPARFVSDGPGPCGLGPFPYPIPSIHWLDSRLARNCALRPTYSRPTLAASGVAVQWPK